MGLQAAVARAQVLIKALSGIKGAPATIPNKLRDFPFSVAYPGRGTWARAYMGDQVQNTGEIVVELYLCTQARGINFAVTRLMDYFETLPVALMRDDTLNANITTQGMGPPTITCDPLLAGEYAGVEVFFYRWRLNYEREEDL